jgi:hypothetical protein
MGKPTGLAKAQQRSLGRLKSVAGLRSFYLAGGSALAYHLGHRRSNDLDLFSGNRDVDLAALRRELEGSLPDLEVAAQSDATLKVKLAGEPIDIVSYPYPPLEPPTAGPEGFPIAGLTDIAAMKLAAISLRGIRRDFWDLHEIVRRGFTLHEAARAYVARFKKKQSDLYHVIRSLTYFDDAERAVSFPEGLTPAHWKKIKAFFEDEAPSLLRALVGPLR